jgi:flavorubredoxin
VDWNDGTKSLPVGVLTPGWARKDILDMITVYKASPDIDVLTTSVPIANFGQVPINAFVLHGADPILVDTGVVGQSDDFMASLRKVIDPSELKWLWLSHTDPDHIGSLHQLLKDYPKLRVITTFLGVGIMGLFAPLPMDRVYLLNPGERLTLTDRSLVAFKPPAFDNPCTTGFYDDRTRALFTSDCFGALLQDPPQNAADVSEKDLADGQILWSTIDAPWLHKVDQSALAEELNVIRRMEPSMILSSHLPAAGANVTERLVSTLARVPSAQPFIGPNQPALEQMLQQIQAG